MKACNYKCVISLTSHTKSRMELLPYYLFQSIFKYNLTDYKVVLTLYKDDIIYINRELQLLIDKGLIHLIVADVNLKSHLKYFFAMKYFKGVPIITIDDDTIYPYEMFEYMYTEYLNTPKYVLCRSCQEITFNNHEVNPTEYWNHNPSNEISKANHAEGYAGVLYPPNCLCIKDELISEIYQTIKSDDIYLSILEIRQGISVRYLPRMRHQFVLSTKGEESISLIPDIIKINNGYVNKFKAVFNMVG